MALGFMIFILGLDITRTIGRVGLKVSPVLGPNRTSDFRALHSSPSPPSGNTYSENGE